uniref:Uncharacterized protein LOC111099448 n=1 Tax=Crassostrea virginica TaxID=6565 RepID=A0A8B8A9B8_CRAVI|nr:uncharacterized protein LOC111099448 [Crassostrea virginica]
MLVGENVINPGAVGEYLYNVPTSSSISVKPGDYIAWHTSATEMVSYNTGSSYPILNRRKTSLGDKSPGDLLDWSNVNPESREAIDGTRSEQSSRKVTPRSFPSALPSLSQFRNRPLPVPQCMCLR